MKSGHDKCREVNIGFARGAELPGDHLVPRQPHEAGEQHAEAHDQRGGSHFLPALNIAMSPLHFHMRRRTLRLLRQPVPSAALIRGEQSHIPSHADPPHLS